MTGLAESGAQVREAYEVQSYPVPFEDGSWWTQHGTVGSVLNSSEAAQGRIRRAQDRDPPFNGAAVASESDSGREGLGCPPLLAAAIALVLRSGEVRPSALKETGGRSLV